MLALALAAALAAPNPCNDPARHLACPNLRVPPAGGLELRRTPAGRALLLMDNRLVNVGPGPLEVHGRRTSRFAMAARQLVRRTGGRRPVLLDTGARLTWKHVGAAHGGAYWKFRMAARFELWRMDGAGRRTGVARVGPKLDYCLRDLFPQRGVPQRSSGPRYGACSRVFAARRAVLGISVGWADGYPYHYPENWIDVTGLAGCFAVVQRADPLDRIRETDETDNTSVRVVRLPYRAGPQRCPRYTGVA